MPQNLQKNNPTMSDLLAAAALLMRTLCGPGLNGRAEICG